MRTDVVGLRLDVTDPIREYAERKVEKLDKFRDQILSIMFRLDVEQGHGADEFAVELTVDVEHHEDFVANAKGDDLYLAIDGAVQKAQRQLGDFKEKLKDKH